MEGGGAEYAPPSMARNSGPHSRARVKEAKEPATSVLLEYKKKSCEKHQRTSLNMIMTVKND